MSPKPRKPLPLLPASLMFVIFYQNSHHSELRYRSNQEFIHDFELMTRSNLQLLQAKTSFHSPDLSQQGLDTEDLCFSPDFTSDERAFVHQECRRLPDVESRSYNSPDGRRWLVVMRRRTPRQLFEWVLRHGGQTTRYKLFPPGKHPSLTQQRPHKGWSWEKQDSDQPSELSAVLGFRRKEKKLWEYVYLWEGNYAVPINSLFSV